MSNTGKNDMLTIFVSALILVGAMLDQNRSQADLNLRQIVSAQEQGDVYRALLGYEESYPYLTIEVIELGSESEPHKLVGIWDLPKIDGGTAFSLSAEGMSYSGLRWVGVELRFVFTSGGKKQNCVVSNVRQLRPRVKCGS